MVCASLVPDACQDSRTHLKTTQRPMIPRVRLVMTVAQRRDVADEPWLVGRRKARTSCSASPWPWLRVGRGGRARVADGPRHWRGLPRRKRRVRPHLFHDVGHHLFLAPATSYTSRCTNISHGRRTRTTHPHASPHTCALTHTSQPCNRPTRTQTSSPTKSPARIIATSAATVI